MISCNFFNPGSATKTPDLIGTAVQATMVARITETPSSSSSDTQEATPIVVLTAAITPTEVITTTPDSQKPAIGDPILKDTLSSGNGFGLAGSSYSDDVATASVANGVLTLSTNSTTGWRTWRVRPPEFSDAYLEGSLKATFCASSDLYGLVFRAPDYTSGKGYYFGVTCDGRYSLSKWEDSKTTSLVSLAGDPVIEQGAGKTNRLGILAKGSSLKLYVNDKLLQEVTDGTFSKGYFGVFVGGFSGGLSVDLDEIAYWNAP